MGSLGLLADQISFVYNYIPDLRSSALELLL